MSLRDCFCWLCRRGGLVCGEDRLCQHPGGHADFHCGKQMGDEMRRLIAKDKAVIEEKEKELKKLREDLEKQRTVLTESALRKRK